MAMSLPHGWLFSSWLQLCEEFTGVSFGFKIIEPKYILVQKRISNSGCLTCTFTYIYIPIISNQQICEDAHCLFFDSIEFVGMVLNIVSWVKKRHHLITLEAEQPGSSCLKDCPYISHILTTMGPSFFRRMWMGTYGHWASKPSQLWGSW